MISNVKQQKVQNNLTLALYYRHMPHQWLS